ncbi:hypothetical protein L6164_007477 [Bauhinia variegata]|uniref:Uncharacterized protein n=1 Tax=Bauhinia variegata TaxID=167791 RepID=A0ACB9PF57_BAUVA|nr:hypothetical protein L6164_007477 [Bauhinia variegata]
MADQEEGKIPVFTVLKNGAILKNIFIVNKPPPPISVSEPKSIAPVPDHEEVLLVGRHPDCNLLLTHPSISRFHLQILSKPSLQNLFVIDLQSVHGTWVSGRKLEPGVKEELKEGDTLRIGGSSRVYRLHWIPISQAYDLEMPFVSDSGVTMTLEKEMEDARPEEEKVELVQNEVICTIDNEEIQALDSILESIGSLFTDENSEVTAKRAIPLAPPVPEVMVSDSCGKERKSSSKDDLQGGTSFMFPCWPLGTETSHLPLTSENENEQCGLVNQFLSARYIEPVIQMSDFYADLESVSQVEEENQTSSEAEKSKETIVLSLSREYLTENPSSILEDTQGSKMQQVEGAIHSPPDLCTSQLPPCMQETSFEKSSSNLLLNLDPTSFDETSAATAAEMLAETEFECTLTNNGGGKDILTTGADNFIAEYTSMLVEEAILDTKFQRVKIVEEQDPMNSPSDKKIQEKCWKEQRLLAYSNATCCEQEQSMLVVQDMGKMSTDTLSPISLPAEQSISAIATKKENWAPQSPIAVAGCSEKKIYESCVETKEKHSPSGSIWSRRGKAASAPQIRSSKSRLKITAKVDTEVEMIDEKDIIKKTIPKDLFSVLDGEEVFTPDKENLSPGTLHLRLLKKNGIFEEIKHSKSHGSRNSKLNASPNISLDENMSPTADKENQTPRVAQEQKLGRKPFGRRNKLDQGQDVMALKNRVERTPFKSLMNSGGKKISETSPGGPASVAKSINDSDSVQILDKCTNHTHIDLPQRTNWDMVVDTASLLNKESRKALQLLQGLKGTRLIIPRMVIRELDNMKHQFSIFRRTTEASSVLKWIEECMVATKWWIHVQSSMEEEKLIAPTPRTSPQTEFSEAGWTFPSWNSSPNSSIEIVSPTAEDQILDCALLYRRKHIQGQLVLLLSDDVTLKIKSMAEGLLCETVQEFRESLVNPFSERFLWANSSPRGLTWSCQDDVVLGERYCRNPLRKSSKGEGAKGLKLILLHNSQYGKISCARRIV